MRIPALYCLLSFLLFLSRLDAGTLRRVPQQYRTIQSAINAARVGDTVLVDDGLYYENLRITKNIVLASRFILDRDSLHVARTIIDGSRARDKKRGSTIHVVGSTDTTCVIFGLTIRGGTGSYAQFPGDRYGDDWMVGGGIYVQRAGIRIAYNHVTGNTLRKTGTVESLAGAGIGCFEVPPTPGIPPYVIVEHNLVTLNTAAGKWAEVAGIAVMGPGRVQHNAVIQNRLLFRDRSAGGGIGLILGKRYDIIADGNYVRSNVAGVAGGIYVGTAAANAGRAIIVNNIVADNEAFEVGGGIETTENSNAVVVNNTIVGNRAGSLGDGVMVTTGGTVTLINNILSGNGRYQLSSWTNVRLVNNLIGGGALGANTVDADPLFIPGDTLFRLSSESPAIGTGTRRVYLGGSPIPLPTMDFFGSSRASNASSGMSMGAIEPSIFENSRTREFHQRQEVESQSRLRLTIVVRQVAPPVFSSDSLQKLQAGRMSFSLVRDDTVKHPLKQTEEELTFTLPPESNLLECEYIAHDTNVPRGISRMIQLEGLDQYATISRIRPYIFRRYANLLPGRYHLLTAAGDESGFIAETNKRRIAIVVLPYWYQRWWAYSLLVLMVGGFGTFAYWYEVSRLRREKYLQQLLTQQQMESQEAERKRLASELHDGLGQDLLVVNSEIRQLLADNPLPSEDLQRVSGLVQESIEAVREISSNLHPHHIERLGLCAAVEALIEKLTRSSTLRIESACEPVDAAMSKETKLHVFRIIQESLSNVVKHAGATVVRVDIRKNRDAIDITIQDNGIGFDTAHWSSAASDRKQNDSARGFGLASMAERARIVGGSFTIESIPQRGTTIRLTLPAHKG